MKKLLAVGLICIVLVGCDSKDTRIFDPQNDAFDFSTSTYGKEFRHVVWRQKRMEAQLNRIESALRAITDAGGGRGL